MGSSDEVLARVEREWYSVADSFQVPYQVAYIDHKRRNKVTSNRYKEQQYFGCGA